MVPEVGENFRCDMPTKFQNEVCVFEANKKSQKVKKKTFFKFCEIIQRAYLTEKTGIMYYTEQYLSKFSESLKNKRTYPRMDSCFFLHDNVQKYRRLHRLFNHHNSATA